MPIAIFDGVYFWCTQIIGIVPFFCLKGFEWCKPLPLTQPYAKQHVWKLEAKKQKQTLIIDHISSLQHSKNHMFWNNMATTVKVIYDTCILVSISVYWGALIHFDTQIWYSVLCNIKATSWLCWNTYLCCCFFNLYLLANSIVGTPLLGSNKTSLVYLKSRFPSF